jgi:hypothetical protein
MKRDETATGTDADMAPKKDNRESYLQPSREDRKALLLWLPADLHKDLKRAALDDDVTLQELGENLIRDFIAKRSKAKR